MNFLSNILDYLNPFSEDFILNSVIQFLSNILSYINPLSDNFFGYKIIDMLGDLLEFLFIPSEERITAISNVVSNKFNFIDSIKATINSFKNSITDLKNDPKLVIELGSTKYTQKGNYTIIDFSWYKPFKPYGDLIITCFVYIAYIWRLFVTLPNTINAVGGSASIIFRNMDK